MITLIIWFLLFGLIAIGAFVVVRIQHDELTDDKEAQKIIENVKRITDEAERKLDEELYRSKTPEPALNDPMSVLNRRRIQWL